ncbi:hypothetical protein QCA50_008686 [Cerrena zonata]|uniref:Secreted protein n=1 Tax=Cerrena zonata TaxID=2478898 RepID=A0AAW0GE76_9APHY
MVQSRLIRVLLSLGICLACMTDFTFEDEQAPQHIAYSAPSTLPSPVMRVNHCLLVRVDALTVATWFNVIWNAFHMQFYTVLRSQNLHSRGELQPSDVVGSVSPRREPRFDGGHFIGCRCRCDLCLMTIRTGPST